MSNSLLIGILILGLVGLGSTGLYVIKSNSITSSSTDETKLAENSLGWNNERKEEYLIKYLNFNKPPEEGATSKDIQNLKDLRTFLRCGVQKAVFEQYPYELAIKEEWKFPNEDFDKIMHKDCVGTKNNWNPGMKALMFTLLLIGGKYDEECIDCIINDLETKFDPVEFYYKTKDDTDYIKNNLNSKCKCSKKED